MFALLLCSAQLVASLMFWYVRKCGTLKFKCIVNKNPTDATVCRYLFTAKLLYMFRVSQHPSSGVSKTVRAASGTGHTTCTATPLLRGLVWTGLCETSGAVTPEACKVLLRWINICILLHLLGFYSHWIMMHGTTSLKFKCIVDRSRFCSVKNSDILL